MTTKKTEGPSVKAHQVNWMLDKLGFGIIGYFAVQTLSHVEKMTDMLNSLYVQVQLHEQTIAALKSITGLH
jgi:hypothetical protein